MGTPKKLVCEVCGHTEYTEARHHTNRHCGVRMSIFGRKAYKWKPWADQSKGEFW